MQIIFIVLIILVLLFASVLLFGAPYLPTLEKQSSTALNLLDLKKGQTLLELGCGDGRVLKAAAKQGICSVGYELNPLLVLIAKINTRKYRKIASVKWVNYWNIDWPKSDGIYVFLLDKYMKKLDKMVIQYSKKNNNTKVVSYAFKIPNKSPIQSKNGLYLYKY